MKDSIIDHPRLISEIGLGDTAAAVVDYSKVRLSYLVCGLVRCIEERDAVEMTEYGAQLKLLASNLYAEPLNVLVDDILRLGSQRQFYESRECLVDLLAINKQLSSELSSLSSN